MIKKNIEDHCWHSGVIAYWRYAFVTNAFVGNPFSAAMANKAVKQYVNQNYSFLDLELGKADYDFKNQGYRVYAKSKTSIDTRFAIYYSEGKVQRDDYQTFVLGMFNTLDRLTSEYTLIARTIIADELGYETTRLLSFYKVWVLWE